MTGYDKSIAVSCAVLDDQPGTRVKRIIYPMKPDKRWPITQEQIWQKKHQNKKRIEQKKQLLREKRSVMKSLGSSPETGGVKNTITG